MNSFINALLEELPNQDKEIFIQKYNEFSGIRRAEKDRIEKLFSPNYESEMELEGLQAEVGGLQQEELSLEELLKETDINYEETPIGNEFIAPDTMTPGSASLDPSGIDIPEQEELEGTRVMRDMNAQLKNHPSLVPFKRLEKGGNLLPQTVEEVDVNDLTEADFAAARQLMNGETPTANLYENLATAGLAKYGRGVG